MPSDDLPADIRSIAAVVTKPQPMRRGSIGERFMKCGKHSCPCHTDLNARHGPYFVLTRSIDRTTKSRFLTPTQAQVARTQVARGVEFREQIERYWQACEKWADSELETTEDVEVAKKGASRKPLQPKWPRKSRRS